MTQSMNKWASQRPLRARIFNILMENREGRKMVKDRYHPKSMDCLQLRVRIYYLCFQPFQL